MVVPSEVVVGSLLGLLLGVLTGISIDLLTAIDGNTVFVVAADLEFPAPTIL